MDFILMIIILIGVPALLGLGVWLFIVITSKEDLEDNNVIINFMPQHTVPIKGYFLGTEINTDKVGDRYFIEFMPRGIRKKEIEDTPIIPVSIVADKNKVITLPFGDSSKIPIKIILPPNPEDFPKELKETSFGKALMSYVEKINVDNVEAEIIREGSERKTKIAKRMPDGEVSNHYLDMREDMEKDMIKNLTETKSQYKPTFPAVGQHV